MNKITINTERLIIRPVEISDTSDVHEYASDRSITMMMFLPNENIDETMSFVEYAAGEWKKEEPHDREFVMVYHGKIIGGINLESTELSGNYEIGWTVHHKYRNQGFATEAAKALIEYAFKNLFAVRVTAHCDSENKASESVMKNVGMKLICSDGTRTYPKTGKVSGEYMYAIEKTASFQIDTK